MIAITTIISINVKPDLFFIIPVPVFEMANDGLYQKMVTKSRGIQGQLGVKQTICVQRRRIFEFFLSFLSFISYTFFPSEFFIF